VKTRGRERILNVVLAYASLLIFLGGAEIFCRLVRPDERWFKDPYLRDNSLYQLLRYDPTLGWSGRPFAKVLHTEERLNSRGLRGSEFHDEKLPARSVSWRSATRAPSTSAEDPVRDEGTASRAPLDEERRDPERDLTQRERREQGERTEPQEFARARWARSRVRGSRSEAIRHGLILHVRPR